MLIGVNYPPFAVNSLLISGKFIHNFITTPSKMQITSQSGVDLYGLPPAWFSAYLNSHPGPLVLSQGQTYPFF
jgi:hypothetical protein